MSKKTKPATTFADYVTGLDPDEVRVVAAYSDCLPETVNADSIGRNINFLSNRALNLTEATKVMRLAVPFGYNRFDVEEAMHAIAAVFGENAQVLLAREHSVCMYVKPSKNVWLSRGEVEVGLADEVSFVTDLGMFRIWWD